jgi:hypothetical protein
LGGGDMPTSGACEVIFSPSLRVGIFCARRIGGNAATQAARALMLSLDLQESRTENPERIIHFVWPNGDHMTIRAVVASKGKARLQFDGVPAGIKIHKGALDFSKAEG